MKIPFMGCSCGYFSTKAMTSKFHPMLDWSHIPIRSILRILLIPSGHYYLRITMTSKNFTILSSTLVEIILAS